MIAAQGPAFWEGMIAEAARYMRPVYQAVRDGEIAIATLPPGPVPAENVFSWPLAVLVPDAVQLPACPPPGGPDTFGAALEAALAACVLVVVIAAETADPESLEMEDLFSEIAITARNRRLPVVVIETPQDRLDAWRAYLPSRAPHLRVSDVRFVDGQA